MHQTISNDEFYQKQKNDSLSIVDVREVYEYAAGHIPEAENMPLSQFVKQAETLDKTKHHYVVCQSGGRSSQACGYLSQLGYNVTNVMGGMSAWKGEVTRG